MTHRFEVWQDGECLAGVSHVERNKALAEACRYRAMYEQDGPATIKERKGRKLTNVDWAKEMITVTGALWRKAPSPTEE